MHSFTPQANLTYPQREHAGYTGQLEHVPTDHFLPTPPQFVYFACMHALNTQ